MRLKQSPPPWNQHRSNGNTAQLISRSQQAAIIARAPAAVYNNHWNNTENSFYEHSTRLDTTTDLNNETNNFNYTNSNVTNANEVNPTAKYGDYTSPAEQTALDDLLNSLGDKQVCNRQYRESLTKSVHFVNKNIQKNVTLEGNIVSQSEDSEVAFVDNQITPHDEEERMFEQSDTDETSDSAHLRLRPVPRGIVNPNYPGFQHLAHTLQDYSKNIDNFYHSENEMTDDDLDAEVIDLSYDAKDEELFRYDIGSGDPNLSNNNNNYENNETITKNDKVKHKNNTYVSDSDDEIQNLCVDVITKNNRYETSMDEVPDLLKNVNTTFELANNNVDDSDNKESMCLDTDIENNFSVTNIIGDFNKEVEDEINNIFKCNLHFQDDLRELRKDIEVAFKKPIENTINHISEVVNQVIKHLVTEHEENREFKSIKNITIEQFLQNKTTHISEDPQISKENESNIKKEMKQSRPTFLFIENNINSKTLDAFLSDAKDELQVYDDTDFHKGHLSSNTVVCQESDLSEYPYSLEEIKVEAPISPLNSVDYDNTPISIDDNSNDISGISLIGKLVKSLEGPGQSNVPKKDKTASNVHIKEELSQGAKEKDVDTSIAQENVSRTKPNYKLRRERRNSGGASSSGARQPGKAQAKQSVQNKNKCDDTLIGSFDVYNIETAMPKLDLDAIESHLRAAKEAERRKRNDREEIRRRLATGAEADECGEYGEYRESRERPGRKPSLHSRLQSGMNLQICFMNETVSDNESQASDSERSPGAGGGCGTPAREAASAASSYLFNHPYKTRPLSTSILRTNKSTQGATAKTRPSSLSLKPSKLRSSQSLGHVPLKESDLYALQATLQTEARIALAQAKEMARIQMERERQCRAASPVTEMLRKSLEKANSPLTADRRRVSRQLLTHMNIAQLQVIVNSLHGEVELLSEALVRLLMSRDELHMGQDSMLVDIEDLTRYLGVKEQGKKSKAAGVRRLAALVHN